MAPGSVGAADTSIEADKVTNYAGAHSASMSKDSVQMSTLPPKLQRLVKEYHQLGWFESIFGFTAPIVWMNVYKMVVLHLIALLACFHGPQAMWQSWWFFVVMLFIAGMGVTAGVHRYWCHKSYKARLPLQIFFMLANCLAMQNDILEWSRDHRSHHKYSETNADPHNAKRGFFFAHIGWLLMKKHPNVLIKGKNVDLSDLQRDPVVQFQHRFYLPLSLFITFVLPVIIPYFFWGEDPWVAFTTLAVFRYIVTLHSTWLVNSAAHLWGAKHYDKTINPADNRFVSVAAMGEGWHNYHHTFPYDYSTSEWGPKINMTTIFIDLMAALGLVYDRKQVSQEAIERVRCRLGDRSL